MYIRAGPWFTLCLLTENENFSCVCNIKIWLFQILCLSEIEVCFYMKKLKITNKLQLIFQ